MENREMTEILQRYNVGPAHSLIYSYQEFKNLGLNPDFIFSLLDVFGNNKEFSKDAFYKFPLEVIVDYIQKTHHYYLSKKLLEIEQTIHLLLLDYSQTHPLLYILHSFYADYRNNLTNHIGIEEKFLLPYILYLVNQEKENQMLNTSGEHYSLQQFFEHHHDTEKDLKDVRNAILQYSPPPTNETPYRILISQLQILEKDLAIHALIEDEVLIPRAMALEKKLMGAE